MENFDLCKHSTRGTGTGKIISGCKALVCPAIVLLAALCFLPGLGSFGVLDPTDSFFIEAAREMIERHHYLTALYNYSDWLDKPILSFLPIILTCKLLGMNTWAARLSAALSGIALVVATYIFTNARLGTRTAILSAIVLCSSPLFLLTGHVALSDEALSLFFGIAMFSIGRALISSKQRLNIAAYVFLALAILTKGPIPLILALGAIIFYLLITCSSATAAVQKFKQLNPLVGLVILLILCLPYFYLAHVTTNGAFTTQFFWRQNLGRMLGTVNHQEPIWFYIPILLGGYCPWILYLLLSLPWLRKIFLVRKQLTQRQSMVVFCCCWALTVLTLFTLVPTKLPTYIVPFSPALAVIVAAYLKTIIRLSKIKTMQLRMLIFLSVPPLMIFIAAAVGLWFLPLASREYAHSAAQLITNHLPSPTLLKMSCSTAIIITGTLCIISSWFFWRQKMTKAVLSLSAASVLACIVLIPCSFLWMYQTRQAGFNNLVNIANANGGHLAILFSRLPSVVYVLHRPIPEIQSLDELVQFCRLDKKPHLLLATKNCFRIPELQAEKHVMASNGRWYLLNVEGYPW